MIDSELILNSIQELMMKQSMQNTHTRAAMDAVWLAWKRSLLDNEKVKNYWEKIPKKKLFSKEEEILLSLRISDSREKDN